MHVIDLGTMRYHDAWALQEKVHAEVLTGGQERLLLVEHPPVITFGRRAQIEGPKNLLAPEESLRQLGVEVIQSDRGGDVTFHGPGQIVAYPIIRLNDHGLSVGGYVRKLEQIIISALSELGVQARTDSAGIGVWVEQNAERRTMNDEQNASPSSADIRHSTPALAKIAAIGVRIRKGVSMHGIALNVQTDLRYFDLIVPCGLVGRPVTSLQKLLGDAAPDLPTVKSVLVRHFKAAFCKG